MVPRCGRRSRRWRIRSLGMPGGVGGTHAGPAAMLTEVWTPIARRFAARPVPERFLSCDGGEMLVLGHYRGQPPGSGHPFVAPFAHELAFRDGRIAELRQITDTQQWVNAARNGAVGVVEGGSSPRWPAGTAGRGWTPMPLTSRSPRRRRYPWAVSITVTMGRPSTHGVSSLLGRVADIAGSRDAAGDRGRRAACDRRVAA